MDRSSKHDTADDGPSAAPAATPHPAYRDAALTAIRTGPIVLVVHSFGGNVISVAASGNDQVKALVYLNG